MELLPEVTSSPPAAASPRLEAPPPWPPASHTPWSPPVSVGTRGGVTAVAAPIPQMGKPSTGFGAGAGQMWAMQDPEATAPLREAVSVQPRRLARAQSVNPQTRGVTYYPSAQSFFNRSLESLEGTRHSVPQASGFLPTGSETIHAPQDQQAEPHGLREHRGGRDSLRRGRGSPRGKERSEGPPRPPTTWTGWVFRVVTRCW